MSVNIAPDATALVMDSAQGFTSLLEAAGATALARGENAWTNAHSGSRPAAAARRPQLLVGTFDNQPTWDNPTPVFDNRPTWDNWKNK
ncbi:multiple cyclophane-containing RiPP AmcA [Streptomyces sp. NPDC051907]|uniref:multiple cyclophane-containing RiPP AmcA n=1 Tax=Streptomyces sp. NPDC051907 TaxID=3155284 RepID=UPI00341F5565